MPIERSTQYKSKPFSIKNVHQQLDGLARLSETSGMVYRSAESAYVLLNQFRTEAAAHDADTEVEPRVLHYEKAA